MKCTINTNNNTTVYLKAVLSFNNLTETAIKNFMKGYFIKLLIVMSLPALVVACGSVKPKNPGTGSSPSGLHAVLYPSSESFRSSREGRVNAMIINSGSSDVAVDMWSLGQSMLALVVTCDDTGERMLPVGPATPRSPEEMRNYLKILKPGKKIEVSYTLHIFSPGLPRGGYSIRMAHLPSNSVSVIIR
jgi:hypothetical protein